MRPPELHVAAFGLAVAMTVGFSAAWFGPPTVRRALVAVAVGVAIGSVSAALGLHKCHEGNPVHQWLVPSACAVAVILFVRQSAVRVAAVVFLAVLGVFLSGDFAAVVHGREYVGRAAPSNRSGSVGIPDWFTPLTGFYHRGEDGETSPVTTMGSPTSRSR
jgi:hypothetical protein